MSVSPKDVHEAAWWPELLAVKDGLSYDALAQRFRVPVHTIRRALELAGETKVNLPRGPKARGAPAGPSTGPLDHLRAKAGKMPDAEVAAQAGVSVDEVKHYRREHGIAAFLRAPPGAHQVPLAVAAPRAPAPPAAAADPLARFRDRLGTVADQVIADEAGVARTAVGEYRRKLGIAAYVGFRFRPESPPQEDRAERRTRIEPYLSLLGTVPDSEIAALADVPTEEVAAFRVGCGILEFVERPDAAPPAPSVAVPPAVEPVPRRRRVSKLDPHAHLLGVLSDAQVAARAGVTVEAARMFRHRAGIPARGARGVDVDVPAGGGEAVAGEQEVAAPGSAAVEPIVVEPAPAPVAVATEPVVQPQAEAAPVVPASVVGALSVDAPSVDAPSVHLAARAFAVIALRGEERCRFVSVGKDITEGLAVAIAALAARSDGPWRVHSVRDLVEALLAPVAAPVVVPATPDVPAPAPVPTVAEPEPAPEEVAPAVTHPEALPAIPTGAGLSAYRLAHGLSQRELGTLLSLRQSTISRFETAADVPLPAAVGERFRALA